VGSIDTSLRKEVKLNMGRDGTFGCNSRKEPVTGPVSLILVYGTHIVGKTEFGFVTCDTKRPSNQLSMLMTLIIFLTRFPSLDMRSIPIEKALFPPINLFAFRIVSHE
jgi:hypothetical protein